MVVDFIDSTVVCTHKKTDNLKESPISKIKFFFLTNLVRLTNRPLTNRPLTNRPLTNRPLTKRPQTQHSAHKANHTNCTD